MEGPGGPLMFWKFASDVSSETKDLTKDIEYEGKIYSGQVPNFSALNMEDFQIAVRKGTTTSDAEVSSTPSSQQVVTGADVGLLQWGITELFRR